MGIDVCKLERNYLVNAEPQRIETFPSSPSETKDHPLQTSLNLHQVFNQDVIDTLMDDSVAVEAIPLSLWDKILSWFIGSNKEAASPIQSSKKNKELVRTQSETIHPTPVLEQPTYIPDNLQSIHLSPVSKKSESTAKLDSSDIETILSKLSDHSIESIMFLIFKTQVHLEKEHAKVAEGTFSKYLDFKKLQQEVLGEIKDILVKDENTAKYFSTAHNIALAGTFIAGMIGVAVSFGYAPPLLGFITGPSAAGLTASTLGGKAYFQRVLSEHKAKHEEHTHKDQHYNDRADDARNRLMTTAEADSAFKERWAQLLRRSDKMRKLVLKK